MKGQSETLVIALVPESMKGGILRTQVVERLRRESRQLALVYNGDVDLPNDVIIIPGLGSLLQFLLGARKGTKIVLYARSVKLGIFASILALIFRHVRTWYDFRGFSSYEKYWNRRVVRSRQLLDLAVEGWVYWNADFVSTVSGEFRYELYSHFGSRSCVVVPCCVPASRVKRKVKSKAGGKLRLVYSGSLLPWQCYRETLGLYQRIAARLPYCELQILTMDLVAAREIVEKEGYSVLGIRFLSCDSVECVDSTLADCQFGFLLRKEGMVNAVSSPVKFAEYLANGISPILSSAVKDSSSMVARRNLGVVLQDGYFRDWPESEIDRIVAEMVKLQGDDDLSYRLSASAVDLTWERQPRMLQINK